MEVVPSQKDRVDKEDSSSIGFDELLEVLRDAGGGKKVVKNS